MLRRPIVWIGILGLAAIIYGVFFMSNDEDEIRDRIADLAEAACFSEGTNPAIYGVNVKAALKEALTPEATVDAAELGGAQLTATDVAGGALRFAGIYRSATVTMTGLKVDIAGATATASGSVALTGTQHGSGVRVEERPVRFELAKIDGAWRITRIVVEPRQ